MYIARPKPMPHEHILNYLVRLSEKNGYKNTIQVLRCTGIQLTNNRLPANHLFTGEFDLKSLAELCGLTVKELNPLFLKIRPKGFYKFDGIVFPIVSIGLNWPRLCPQCFIELGYQPVQQLLLAMTYCSKHATVLVERSPETGKRLTWSTPYLSETLKKLTKTKSIKNRVSSSTKELCHTIELLADGQTFSLGQDNEHAFHLDDFLLLLHFIHKFRQRSTLNKGSLELSNGLMNANNDMLCTVFTNAYIDLKKWPYSYYTLLKYFEENPMSRDARHGIRHCFRDLYDELYDGQYKTSSAYLFLRHWFERYLQEEYSRSAFKSSLTKISTDVSQLANYITEKAAIQLLECPVSRIKIYLRLGMLKTKTTSDNMDPVYSRQEVKLLKEHLSHCISLSKAAEILHLSRYQTRSLFLEQIIKPEIRPDALNRDWLVDVRSIDRLLQQLKQLSITSLPEGFQLKTFSQLQFRGDNISSALQKMLSEEYITVYSPNHVSSRSLHQFTIGIDTKYQPKNYINPRQAAIDIGVNINAIYHFMKRGYLEHHKISVGRSTRPVKLIPSTSIMHFKKTYALSHQVKPGQQNVHSLVSGPDIDKGVVKLYSRLKNQ